MKERHTSEHGAKINLRREARPCGHVEPSAEEPDVAKHGAAHDIGGHLRALRANPRRRDRAQAPAQENHTADQPWTPPSPRLRTTNRGL